MTNLIQKHGGYIKLMGFIFARLVYYLTVKFCERYIDHYSRTRDQMIQTALSGVQNIAEGSEASATYNNTELKLTQVTQADLEELKLDYEDYLRQLNLTQWDRDNPLRQDLLDHIYQNAHQVAQWIVERCKEKAVELKTDYHQLIPDIK